MVTQRPRQWGKPKVWIWRTYIWFHFQNLQTLLYELDQITYLIIFGKGRDNSSISHWSVVGTTKLSTCQSIYELQYALLTLLLKNRLYSNEWKGSDYMAFQVHWAIWFALTMSAGSTRQGPWPEKLKVQLRRQNLQACSHLPSWIHEKANKIYC